MNLKNLKFIFKPKYWTMNNPYSAEWDKELNRLLDIETFEHVPLCLGSKLLSTHTVKLGNYTLWISNFPYSSFRPHTAKFRASRLTIERAAKAYLKSKNINFSIMDESTPQPSKYNNIDLFTSWKKNYEQ